VCKLCTRLWFSATTCRDLRMSKASYEAIQKYRHYLQKQHQTTGVTHNIVTAGIADASVIKAEYVSPIVSLAAPQARRWFCHYYSIGAQKWTKEGGERIAKEARELKNSDGKQACFDRVLTFTKDSLDKKWVKDHARHFACERGGGFWVWKPKIILLTLDQMAPGDLLMYADSGCVFIGGSVEPLFDLLQDKDIVCFESHVHKEGQYTKADVFRYFGPKVQQSFRHTLQRIGGYFLLRNTPNVRKIIQRWQDYCDQLELVNDSPSRAKNTSEFVDHRHDQSGWSLLTKICNISAFPDIGWPVESSKILVAARRIS
jgi:hypothetical protein